MTVYAKIENGAVTEYPLYEGDVRSHFPNTSFPASGFVTPEGFVVVQAVQPPEFDYTMNVVEGTPVQQSGTWVQQWIKTDASDDEKTERTNAQAGNVRGRRNTLLAECDWTQLQDAPVNQQAWANYRQALRDVTAQAGFPWDIAWPEKPTA